MSTTFPLVASGWRAAICWAEEKQYGLAPAYNSGSPNYFWIGAVQEIHVTADKQPILVYRMDGESSFPAYILEGQRNLELVITYWPQDIALLALGVNDINISGATSASFVIYDYDTGTYYTVTGCMVNTVTVNGATGEALEVQIDFWCQNIQQSTVVAGVTTSASSTILTDTNLSLQTNVLIGYTLMYLTGPAASQTRTITANSSDTITTAAFSPAPTVGGGDQFQVISYPPVLYPDFPSDTGVVPFYFVEESVQIPTGTPKPQTLTFTGTITNNLQRVYQFGQDYVRTIPNLLRTAEGTLTATFDAFQTGIYDRGYQYEANIPAVAQGTGSNLETTYVDPELAASGLSQQNISLLLGENYPGNSRANSPTPQYLNFTGATLPKIDLDTKIEGLVALSLDWTATGACVGTTTTCS